jgi:hypothetical protein
VVIEEGREIGGFNTVIGLREVVADREVEGYDADERMHSQEEGGQRGWRITFDVDLVRRVRAWRGKNGTEITLEIGAKIIVVAAIYMAIEYFVPDKIA